MTENVSCELGQLRNFSFGAHRLAFCNVRPPRGATGVLLLTRLRSFRQVNQFRGPRALEHPKAFNFGPERSAVSIHRALRESSNWCTAIDSISVISTGERVSRTACSLTSERDQLRARTIGCHNLSRTVRVEQLVYCFLRLSRNRQVGHCNPSLALKTGGNASVTRASASKSPHRLV